MRTAIAGVLCLALLGISFDGSAQQAAVRRVAYVSMVSPLAEITGADPANPAIRAFVHRLRELGYVDGRNLKLDIRTLEGDASRAEAIASDFARQGTDVIVLPTSALVPAVRRAAPSTPIVMLVGSNVLESGLVQSLARPGGSITGLSVDVDTEIEGKRLEMLLEFRPGARRVAYVGSREDLQGIYGQRLQTTAQRLGITVIHAASSSQGFAAAFTQVAREKADALVVAHGAVAYGHRQQIGEMAAASGIPSSCAHGEAVAHGCLMSYGASLVHVLRRAAEYVDRILKGTHPGDLPIEQPTVFELMLNAKTARALGLEIPRSILLRADRVFE
jgi:putative tryptophan/tyrosine transport system substrate-binding protein